MAKTSSPTASKGGFFGKLFGGMSSRQWKSDNLPIANGITQADAWQYGAGSTTVSALLQSGKHLAEARQVVYQRWADMESDGVCSSAMMLLVTAALGRDEHTGQSIYIEKNPAIEGNQRLSAMVDEMSKDLTGLFNRVAYTTAYTGAAFGDSYSRVYADSRGVTDLYIGELVRPILVQPFEQGSKTVGYAVYIGERNFERLNVSQMARMQMPRTQWVPQIGVVQKAYVMPMTEDDVDNLPLMPSMAGGSLFFNAEEAYNNLNNSIMGLVTQRWKATLNHNIVGVQMEGMTKDQQALFYQSVKDMYTAVKATVSTAIKNQQPIADSITSILPMWGDKQLVTLSQGVTTTQTITVDDIMFHAKMLAGALGVDLSMLGFAELLSGGLGDGGFVRTSSMMGERASVIRGSMADFFNQIIDIHTMKRYGVVFEANNRPWVINFYGSIAALEAERQRTKTDSMNEGLMLAQAIQLMKDMGATPAIMVAYLTTNMMLDEAYAKILAGIVSVPTEPQAGDNEPV